jgi:hypothetical protein
MEEAAAGQRLTTWDNVRTITCVVIHGFPSISMGAMRALSDSFSPRASLPLEA